MLQNILRGVGGHALSWCHQMFGLESIIKASKELAHFIDGNRGLEMRLHNLPMATWKFLFTCLLTAVLGVY